MKFLELKLNNFLSFRSAKLDLSVEGLYLLDGVVVGSKSFSSNGAGKSSIFEAMVWGLFGETLRSVESADGVINNRRKKDCRVSVKFQLNDEVLEVVRYRKHHKHSNEVKLLRRSGENMVDISGDSNKTVQSQINQLIGLDFDSFTNSVIFGQGNVVRFTTATDSHRKQILEELLGLTYLSDSYDKAKAVVSDANRKIYQYELELNSLSEKKKVISTTISRLEWNERGRKQQLVIDIRQAVEDLKEIESDIDTEEALILTFAPDSKNNLNSLQSELEKLVVERNMLVKELNDITDHSNFLLESSRQLDKMNWELEELDKGYRALSGLKGKCSKCGQEINRKTVEKQLSELRSKKDDIRKRYDKLNSLVKPKAKEMKKRREMANQLKILEGKVSSATRNLQDEITNNKRRKESSSMLPSKYVSYSWQVRKIMGLVRQFKSSNRERVSELESDLKSVTDQELNVTELMKKEKKKLKYYEFWKEAFSNRGIKAMVLDNVVEYLNIRANRYSDILTEGEIQIEISSTKVLNSGETRDKLSVICSRKSAGSSYKSISGGEKKRADLCIALALRDLVSSRGHNAVDMLFIDEAFESLDEVGVDRTVALLEEMSREHHTIYVATHLPGLKDYFDNRVTVVNEEGISRIDYV